MKLSVVQNEFYSNFSEIHPQIAQISQREHARYLSNLWMNSDTGIISTMTWHPIPYPVSTYTFPTEALIHKVRFDQQYIHLDLTDGRILSIPLAWIPTLHNAAPAERRKFTISRDRKALIWDPDVCAINDELFVEDYLAGRTRS